VTVTAENEVPAITALGGTIICGNTNTQISATANTTVTYEWTGPNNFQSAEQNPLVETAGVYNLLVTNANGCTNQASVTVTAQTAAPIITANRKGTGCTTILDVEVEENFTIPHIAISGENLTCATNKVTLKGLSNDNIQTFTWEDSNGIIGTTQEIEVIEAGTYILTGTTENGCSTTEVFTVNAETEVPTIELKADDLTCANPMTTLNLITATTDLSINWTGPENFSSVENNPIVALPGTYEVQVTNSTGCSNTATITVNQAGTSAIQFAETTALSCQQEIVTIDASASILTENVSVEWTTENGNIIHQINELMVSVNEAGTYALTVRDLETECVTVETITIAAAPAISARIENDNVLTCATTSITLTAAIGDNSENAVYNWVTENGNIISDRAKCLKY